MKLAKSILSGIAAFGLAAGTALAAETPSVNSDPIWVYEESYVMLSPQMSDLQESGDSASYYSVYGVDDDMDGRTDRLLIIPESDTLG